MSSAKPIGWSQDTNLTIDDDKDSRRPSIDVYENRIHIIWMDQRHYPVTNAPEIYYKNSTDGGRTWNPEVRLTFNESLKDYPRMAINQNNIHLVWTDDRDVGNTRIYYKNSTDGGHTWSDDKRISPLSADASGQNADISVNGNTIHVVYPDADRLKYINSTDNGDNWSVPQQLTPGPIRQSSFPAIAVNGKNIHIVWMDHYNKSGDGTAGAIFYINSSDGGLTWSEEFNLTSMNLDADYPDIAVNRDNIHVTYCEQQSGLWQIYYKRSEDSGITWTDEFIVSNSTENLSRSVIKVRENAVFALWSDKKNPIAEVYLRNSSDNGQNWDNEIRMTYDPAACGYPNIAIGNDSLHLVWSDWRDGAPEIYYKQYPIYADLSIAPDNITFSDNIPNVGMPTQINATIQNIGDENASATIEFWDGDPDNGGFFIDSTDILVNISKNVNATINWVPQINGSHNIYVKITNVRETNLSNNIANKSVLVNREPELGNIPSTFTLIEDSIENYLINLSDYAKDDLDSWGELTFSVIIYSNSSIVGASIFDGYFLSVDTLDGSSNDNWTGTIEIMIEVTDTNGLTNVSNQFTVVVTEVNDAPVVINPILNFSIEEDTSDSITVNLTNIFFDSDNSSLYYTFSGNTNISVIIHENGLVTFTPSENWTGDETITFYATDNISSPVSDSVTVTLTPVDDAPVVIKTISDFNMNEDMVIESIIDLTEIFRDVDNATLYYLYSGNNNISVIINENGSVTFIPAENWSGMEIINFYATDNLTTPISEDVIVTVIPINDPPVIINPISDFNMFEDTVNSTAVDLNSIFYDVDSTSLYYYYSGNVYIDVVINQDDSVTFTPLRNWTGSETITFYATDNLSSPASEEVTITVIGINDPMIITILSPSNNSNHFTSDMIYFNITVFDVDNNSFTYLWDFGDGTTSTLKNVTHQFSEVGIYNVTITVNDGSNSETRVVTIVVEPKTTDGDGNGVTDDDGSDTLAYLWILIGIIIVITLLFFFVWRRSKIQKGDSEVEINSAEDEK